MCLAMCLKKQEFQADCIYKLGVYKKKCVHVKFHVVGQWQVGEPFGVNLPKKTNGPTNIVQLME